MTSFLRTKIAEAKRDEALSDGELLSQPSIELMERLMGREPILAKALEAALDVIASARELYDSANLAWCQKEARMERTKQNIAAFDTVAAKLEGEG